MGFVAGLVLSLIVAVAAPAGAQPTAPFAANVTSLVTYPDFYQGKPVVVRGEVELARDRAILRSDDGLRTLQVIFRGQSPSGLVDLRGELWDVGRMKPDDSRTIGYDLTGFAGPDGRDWPKPGEVHVLAASNWSDAQRTSPPTIRSLVLEPDRYEGQELTLRGQYRGRNLFGEVARAPGISRFDFLIRSAGAAIWVTGMRPRGRGFDFSLDSKLDTGRWLEVTGTFRRGRGLEWLEATSIRMTTATEEKPEEPPAAPPPPPAPPPEVIFSIPTDGETEVPPAAPVRIQVSRDLDPETFKGHIRAGYVGQAPEGGPPSIEMQVGFDRGNRAIEITFTRPLERFRTVRIELTEGILGTDGQPLKPWTLTFSVGG